MAEHRVAPQYRQNEDRQTDRYKETQRMGRQTEKEKVLFNESDNYYDCLPLEPHE